MSRDEPLANSSPSSARTLLFRVLVAVVVVGGGLVAVIWYANR